MGRRALTKKQKVLNLLSKGAPVSWTTLRNRFDLTSPRAMIDTLREEGHMVYINQTSNGTSYRMGIFKMLCRRASVLYTANKNTHISILLYK